LRVMTRETTRDDYWWVGMGLLDFQKLGPNPDRSRG
jgi:hypothetical protein